MDSDIEWAKLTQPFITGSKFTLKPHAGPKVSIQLFNVESEKGFIDVAKFPFAKMYSIHRMKDLPEGKIEIMHIVRVEGFLAPLWWQLIGKKVAAGMSAQAKQMIERTKKLNG